MELGCCRDGHVLEFRGKENVSCLRSEFISEILFEIGRSGWRMPRLFTWYRSWIK